MKIYHIYNLRERCFLVIIFFAVGSLTFTSCKKDWLDRKPTNSLIIPESIEELQALLDYDTYMNTEAPFMGELSSDDHFVPNQTFINNTGIVYKSFYTWDKDIYKGDKTAGLISDCWSKPYRMILYANTALAGIVKVSTNGNNLDKWNNVKGSAYFYRAFAMHQLVQTFGPAYSNSSLNDLGVPIKLKPNIEEPILRATLKANYNLIVSDLIEAVKILPSQQVVKTRPSKVAAFSLLARVFLDMGDYQNALAYSDSALKISSELMDFNSINSAPSFPIQRFNTEVIFHFTKLAHTFTSTGRVDTNLYNSYTQNDLRKKVYFSKQTDGYYRFKGSYNANITQFNGLAVDEMLLIRAECHARNSNNLEALKDLNFLLKKRYDSTFSPVTSDSPELTLRIILEERRKELVFRGIRWADLKRLNLQQEHAITIKRVVSGVSYILPPNDPRYTLPIPEIIIELSGIPQTLR